MKGVKTFEDFLNESLDSDKELLQQLMDIQLGEDDFLDIDLDIEDEEGSALDIEDEQTGDGAEERARLPKMTKKMRNANKVKSKVTKDLLGPEGKLRPFVEKIFKLVEREIKKEASKSGVPKGQINLDKLTIRR